jgi:hypothetical protein
MRFWPEGGVEDCEGAEDEDETDEGGGVAERVKKTAGELRAH